MIDIFFVNTVINIIWYIFSILFVLYKFTSFFSYIYNFGKFLGRITQGAFYIKDRVVEFTEHRRNQHITRPTQVPSHSFFAKIKTNIKNYFWGTPKEEIVLPMYTRVSDISFKPQRNKNEDLHFENCINELMTQPKPKSSFISIDLAQNINDSNYESYYDTSCPTSELSERYIEQKIQDKNQDFINELENVDNESENIKQKFTIQDSNMLFNSDFIKTTLN